jgi:hypothetical protein
MDEEDQNDIIKKVKKSGSKDESEPEGDESNSKDGSEPDGDGLDFGDDAVNENSIFGEPIRNNMFQPGSNDILDEQNPCWSGYKQLGMKEKNGKEVPNCVPINEDDNRESNNYMFWQNIKNINHVTNELLSMNKEKIDSLIANGHAWAVDHISTSADDMEEVYHFLEGQFGYDGDTEGGYSDEHGNVESVNLNEDFEIKEKNSIFDKNHIMQILKETFSTDNTETEVIPTTKPKTDPGTKVPGKIKRRERPFKVNPSVAPKPKAVSETPKESSYEIYHDSFTSAVHEAEKYATSKGYTIDEGDWFRQISTGPAKPNEGVTNKYSLDLYKNGKVVKQKLNIQVYGMPTKYELNMYIA